MRARTHLVSMLGLLAVLLAADARRAEACCAAPQPEPPAMVTPDGSTIAPGTAFVMYLSSRAEQQSIQLVAEPASSTAPSNGPRPIVPPPPPIELTRTLLAPHVYALEVPAGAPFGPRVVQVTPSREELARGASAYAVARVTLGTAPATTRLPAPRGRIRVATSASFRGQSRRAELHLDTPAPSGTGVIFAWGAPGHELGAAGWVQAGQLPVMVSEGRCGIYPHGTDIPGSGTAVRVAFVDARGRLGPWATLPVE